MTKSRTQTVHRLVGAGALRPGRRDAETPEELVERRALRERGLLQAAHLRFGLAGHQHGDHGGAELLHQIGKTLGWQVGAGDGAPTQHHAKRQTRTQPAMAPSGHELR